jgi:hypothetical protein
LQRERKGKGENAEGGGKYQRPSVYHGAEHALIYGPPLPHVLASPGLPEREATVSESWSCYFDQTVLVGLKHLYGCEVVTSFDHGTWSMFGL